MNTEEGSDVICEVLQTHGQNQVRKSLSLLPFKNSKVYKSLQMDM